MTTTDKRIVLSAVPVMWLHEIVTANDVTTVVESFLFDNLADLQYKCNLASAASASASNLDITRGDGTIIRFPKSETIISGVTELEVTDVTKSTDATGLGEISATILEAPKCYVSSAMTYVTWSEFLEIFRAKIAAGNKFFATFPTGFSYDSRFKSGGSQLPDGFGFMIGALSTGIDVTANATPSQLKMTLVSYKNTNATKALIGGVTYTAINLKLGGSNDISISPATTGHVVTLETPTDDALLTELLDGNLVFKKQDAPSFT